MLERCEKCGTVWIVYSNGTVAPGMGSVITASENLCHGCEERRKTFTAVLGYDPNELTVRWCGGAM